MKKILGAATALFCALSGAPLAAMARQAEARVYLGPNSVDVSSFDETPGWAPPANPMALVDGNLKTRWASKAKNGQWVVIHFNGPKIIDGIRVNWETAFASAYSVEVSDDGKKWFRVAYQGDGKGLTEVIRWKPVQAEHLRISFLRRVNPDWGISLWEIESYGPQAQNPKDQPLHTVFPWRKEQETDQLRLANRSKPKPVPAPARLSPDQFQFGVNLTSWSESELASEDTLATLKYLKERGVQQVALLTTWFQPTPESTAIMPQNPRGGKTPTDAALGHAINMAHSLGLQVVLKPHLDVTDGTFRANIFPKKGWFDSYWKFVKHYAELAQEYNVAMYCVGVELRGATTWEQENEWRELIEKVRKVYDGPLVYAANWDEYQHVPFWDAVDIIGIDAYFPLTHNKDATLPELVDGWEKWADRIETWRKTKELGLPVMFTELGYPSVDGANVEPWAPMTDKVDRQEQADSYTAAFEVLTKREWFRGFYWWHYFPSERPAVEDLTIRDKPAEGVMTEWYRKLAAGGK